MTFSRFSLHCGQLATSTSFALVWHQINSQNFWKLYNFKKEELFTHSCLGSAKTFNPVFPSSDAAAAGQTCGRTLDNKVTTSRKFDKNISIYAKKREGEAFWNFHHIHSPTLNMTCYMKHLCAKDSRFEA